MGMIRQWATVLLTITAWILLSNHCALGLSGTVVVGFGIGRMPDALRAGEREAGGKSSVLQRVARGRDSRREKRRGRGDSIGRRAGLRCGNF